MDMNLETPVLRARAVHLIRAAAVATCVAGLTGCLTMPPTSGGGTGPVTGAVGGATAANASGELERCERPLGTIAVVEDQNAHWYGYYRSRYGQLGSTVPVLRMMIQQSNCFVVVERGGAMRNLQAERSLEQSGELRGGSNFGRGQMVAADFHDVHST